MEFLVVVALVVVAAMYRKEITAFLNKKMEGGAGEKDKPAPEAPKAEEPKADKKAD